MCAARDFNRIHAGVVHRCDAAADHGAGQHRRPSCVPIDGDTQTEARNERGGRKRQNRQPETVSNRDSRLVRQHGREMGSPDAKPGGNGGCDDPDEACPTCGCTRD